MQKKPKPVWFGFCVRFRGNFFYHFIRVRLQWCTILPLRLRKFHNNNRLNRKTPIMIHFYVENSSRSTRAVMKRHFFLLLFMFTCVIAGMAQKTATTSGNWSNPATWSPSGVPVSSDAVIINPGITVTVDVADAQAASLQLNVAGSGVQTSTLTFNAGSQLTLSGTFTFAQTADRPGIINMTAGGTLQTAGFVTGVTTGSSFIAGAGTLVLTGNNTLPTTLFGTLNNLRIAVATTTLSGITQLTGDLTISSGTLDQSSYPVARSGAQAGTVTIASGAMLRVGATSGFPDNFATYNIHANSTVEFYGLSQLVRGTTYGNLILSGSAKTANGPITVMGNLTTSADLVAGTYTHNIYGDWTNTGNFTAGTSTVEFFGVTEQDMPGVIFNNLRITNAAGLVVAKGDITVTGTYTSTTIMNLLDMGVYRFSMPPTGVISNAGTIRTANTSTTPLPEDKTWGSPTMGTVLYNAATGGQTIVRGTYNNLEVEHSSGGTSTANGDIIIGGNIAAKTAGTIINMGTYQLTHLVVGGIGGQANLGTIRTQNTTLLPLPAGRTWGGTILYDAAAGGQKIVFGTYNHLSVTTSGTENVSSSIVVNGNLVTSASTVINMNQDSITGSFNATGHAGTIRTQAQTTAFTTGKTWGGTMVYDAVGNTAGAQVVIDGSYHNLTISQSRGVNNNVSLPATLNISGNLVFSAQLAGTGQFVSTGGSTHFIFNGTNQSISVTATTNGLPGTVYSFSNVSITGGGTKTLLTPVTVDGMLTLTNGVLQTTSTNILLLTSGASVTAPALGNHDAYVSGPMRRMGTTAFTFPVGKGGVYAPLTISAPGTGGDFTAEYFRGQSTSAYTAPLVRVSPCEYWNLVRTAAANNPTVTLSWTAASNCGSGAYVTDLSALRVAYLDGANWVNAGNSATSGSTATGTVTSSSSTLAAPYGALTLASTSTSQNPLPVRFTAVKAELVTGGVSVEWKTAAESDLANYEVQRSSNAADFNSFHIQSPLANNGGAAGYRAFDPQVPAAAVFYRVKAVDKDGKVSYSSVVRVNANNGGPSLQLFPNPVKGGRFNFSLSGVEPGDYTIAVLDVSGRAVYGSRLRVNQNNLSEQVTLPSGLPAGTYYLRIIGGSGATNQAFIIE